MAKKPILLGYDENGNPMYGLPMQAPPAANNYDKERNGRNAASDYDRERNGRNIVSNYDRERNGRNIEVGRQNSTEPGRRAMEGLVPFSTSRDPDPVSGGNPKLAVDYTKDPYSTTVPGQPGYDQSKDPLHKTPEQKKAEQQKAAEDEKLRKLYERSPSGEWWQKSRGEKTGGSGIDAVHSDAAEARRLQRLLDDERKWAESMYPGAGGRPHSTGGTNLGEPAWSGSGSGASHFGTNEWVTRSGTVVGENGVELVSVIEQWNIYNGQ
jgi:hypothetical protein